MLRIVLNLPFPMRQHKHSRTVYAPNISSLNLSGQRVIYMCVFVCLCVCAVTLRSSCFSRLLHARTLYPLGEEDRTVYLNHPWWVQVHVWCDNDMRCIVLLLSPFHQNPPFRPLTFIFFFLPSKSVLLMVQDIKIVVLLPINLLEHPVPIWSYPTCITMSQRVIFM